MQFNKALLARVLLKNVGLHGQSYGLLQDFANKVVLLNYSGYCGLGTSIPPALASDLTRMITQAQITARQTFAFLTVIPRVNVIQDGE